MRKKITSGLLLLLATTTTFAWSDCDDCGEVTPPTQPAQYFPPSGRTCPDDGLGLFLTGDYIYWNASLSDMATTLKSGAIPSNLPAVSLPSDFVLHQTVENFSSRWAPGFRLGFGFNTPYDEWDLGFVWTSLHTTTSHTSYATPGQQQINPISVVTPTRLSVLTDNDNEVFFQKIYTSWRLKLEEIDGLLTRSYLVLPKLAFHLGFGLKNVWIFNRFHLDTSAVSGPLAPVAGELNGTVRCKNYAWGIGPEVAWDTNWMLGAGFSLFSKLRGALLATRFNTTYNVQGETFSPTTDIPLAWTTKYKTHQVNPYAALGLGIGWEKCFSLENKSVNSMFLRIDLGYEFSYYWNQIYTKTIDQGELSGLGTFISQKPADLALQGLTVNASIGF